ncbi:MAG: hypothetical protein K1X54_09145 [Flavobacteriales bacterium]|nr:hypothetical protein [Flavobacteriales bacterium]
MIQNILVIIAVLFASVWLGKKIWLEYFSGKSKCDGCVIHKIYMAKNDSPAPKSTNH